jgi:hypothetical protein
MIKQGGPAREEIARQALQRGGQQGKEVEGFVGAEKGASDASVVRLTGAAHYAELRYAWPE